MLYFEIFGLEFEKTIFPIKTPEFFLNKIFVQKKKKKKKNLIIGPKTLHLSDFRIEFEKV